MNSKVLDFIIITVIALLTASCGGGAGDSYVAMPRPKAYPRIEILPALYDSVGLCPVALEVNRLADGRISAPKDESVTWMDIVYPAPFDASVYVSVMVAADSMEFEKAVANRLERVALNLGAYDAELIDITSPYGFESQVFVSPSVSTPVQFVATDHKSTIVSATAFLPEAAISPTDSLMPVVKMLERDMLYIVKTLRPLNDESYRNR